MKYKAKRLDNGEIPGTILRVRKLDGKRVQCICECGGIKTFWVNDIEKGKVKSCGCLRYRKLTTRNTTHGKSKSDLYKKYRSMISRCKYPSATGYKNYGGRGISVCGQWADDFQAFQKWALSNGYKENLSLERLDVNGDYEPNNCSWIPFSDQAKNKRPINQTIIRGEKGRIKSVTKRFV